VAKFAIISPIARILNNRAENDDKAKKIVYQYWFRLVVRLKSGGPSLGRSPGAHKQRRPANQNQIQIFGEIGSTQLLEQG
jgi:hypothetical protein